MEAQGKATGIGERTPRTEALGHIPRLDTFRAIATLLVLYTHYFQPMLPAVMQNFVLGFYGVLLFFVLSGFLITSILLADRDAAMPDALFRFYIRRTFRIFPIYYVVLLAGALLAIPGYVVSLPWSALYLTNFCDVLCQVKLSHTGYAIHFWSLAVEEQFYLTWPLVVLLLPLRATAVIAIVAIITGAIAPIFQPALGWAMPIRFLPALCGGALLAMAHQKRCLGTVERILRRLLPITLFGLVFATNDVLDRVQIGHHDWPWRQGLLVPLFCWLIARAVLDGPTASSWGGRLLPALGAISYGVYVLHLPVRYYVDLYDPTWTVLWPRVVGCLVTLALAWLSSRYLEMPLRNYGRLLAGAIARRSTLQQETVRTESPTLSRIAEV